MEQQEVMKKVRIHNNVPIDVKIAAAEPGAPVEEVSVFPQ